MPRSLETVQAEIDALRAAIGRGVHLVRHGDTETRYHNPSDMLLVLDKLQAEADGLAEFPVKQVRFKTSKGFDS